MSKAGEFFWYDLVTSDVPAAVKFYKAVVGWNDEPFPESPVDYVVLKAGERGIGGIMNLPNAQQPPSWLGYIKSEDVDGETIDAVKHGGQILNPPHDIPGGVGRFSVIADPNGAPYMLFTPNGPEVENAPSMTPGTIGWNEYMGDDWQKAFTYYAKLYGWEASTPIEMGEMGIYQLVAKDGVDFGAMMNRSPETPVSAWGFYFVVEGIDAARQRVVDNGGAVVMEPMEVPGGSWAMYARDPQGAHFGLVSDTK